MAKEFDYNKPYTIIGQGDVVYWLQEGRKYLLPRRDRPPMALLRPGAIRTEGGGYIFKCLSCGAEFDYQVKLGRHKRANPDCFHGYMERQAAREKEKGWFAKRVLKKILTEEQYGDFINDAK